MSQPQTDTEAGAEPVIQLEGISKVFRSRSGAVTVLDDISLSVRRGEIFGIIGRSGAGKSTLVRCMNMLERPSSGRVVVAGQDMTALNEKDLRPRATRLAWCSSTSTCSVRVRYMTT